jgi:P-type Ca2+ transporter type 2C
MNIITSKKAISETIFSLWVGSFKDATNVLLAILATVLLVLGIIPAEVLGSTPEEKNSNWIDGLGIYAAVILAATVQTVNQWASDQQWKELDKSRSSWRVKVIRGGVVTMVTKEEVLVGDVVVLGAGDRIPADGLFISGDGTGSFAPP